MTPCLLQLRLELSLPRVGLRAVPKAKSLQWSDFRACPRGSGGEKAMRATLEWRGPRVSVVEGGAPRTSASGRPLPPASPAPSPARGRRIRLQASSPVPNRHAFILPTPSVSAPLSLISKNLCPVISPALLFPSSPRICEVATNV